MSRDGADSKFRTPLGDTTASSNAGVLEICIDEHWKLRTNALGRLRIDRLDERKINVSLSSRSEQTYVEGPKTEFSCIEALLGTAIVDAQTVADSIRFMLPAGEDERVLMVTMTHE